jgi:hypothetical protein
MNDRASSVLHDMTKFNDHSRLVRLLRAGVWLCIFSAATVFWVAVVVPVLSLLA